MLELVEAMCDSILIISKGARLASGPIAELKERMRGDATLEEVFFQVTGGAEAAASEPEPEPPAQAGGDAAPEATES